MRPINNVPNIKKNTTVIVDLDREVGSASVPQSASSQERSASADSSMEISVEQAVDRKGGALHLKSNPFFRYSIATVFAFGGLIAGALAIELAAEGGTRLPVFTPAAMALGAFFLVTKVILPAANK